jgi:hypothetical protein
VDDEDEDEDGNVLLLDGGPQGEEFAFFRWCPQEENPRHMLQVSAAQTRMLLT